MSSNRLSFNRKTKSDSVSKRRRKLLADPNIDKFVRGKIENDDSTNSLAPFFSHAQSAFVGFSKGKQYKQRSKSLERRTLTTDFLNKDLEVYQGITERTQERIITTPVNGIDNKVEHDKEGSNHFCQIQSIEDKNHGNLNEFTTPELQSSVTLTYNNVSCPSPPKNVCKIFSPFIQHSRSILLKRPIQQEAFRKSYNRAGIPLPVLPRTEKRISPTSTTENLSTDKKQFFLQPRYNCHPR